MRQPGLALLVRLRFHKHRLPLPPGLPLLPGLLRTPHRPALEGLRVQGAVSPLEVLRGEAAAEAAEVRQVRPQERRGTRPPQVAEAATLTDVQRLSPWFFS